MAAAAQPEMNLKMMVMPAFMIGIRCLKLDLTAYVVYLRVAYGVATAAMLGAMFWCYLQAGKANDTKEITVVDKQPGGESKTRVLTVAAYDKEQAISKIRQTAFQVCGIHYKWGSPMPLLLQSVMTPVNISDEPLVQLYVFGRDAVGKLARPFKAAANPLADMLGAGDAEPEVTPPAAIEGDSVARKSKGAKKKE
ncbi:putative inorganic phosphate transporter [Pelagophyceae sp. CCMP2097]|nr:putative inorganic phosphate transporter [Pelagophyceae sp. CCMP2097]